MCVRGGGDTGGVRDVLSPHEKDPGLSSGHSVMRDHRPLPSNELLSCDKTHWFVSALGRVVSPLPPPAPSSQLFTNHRQQMKLPQRPGAKCLSEPSSLCSLIVCSPRTRKPPVPTVSIRCLANSSVSTTRSTLSFLCGQAAAQESCRNASAGAKPTMLLGPSKMLSTSHSCSSCGSSVSGVISLWRGGSHR